MLLPPAALRKAIRFARKHRAPLLSRLRTPRRREGKIIACDYGDGDYQLVVEAIDSGRVPRRAHLDWVRSQLEDREGPDSFDCAVGDAYAEAVRDIAARMHEGERGLDERTYAHAYGGPADGTDAQITAWLNRRINLFNTDVGSGGDGILERILAYSVEYQRLKELLELLEPTMPWRDPDTGEAVGRVKDCCGPASGEVLMATTAAAVTCLQWSADLLNVPLRFEVRQF